MIHAQEKMRAAAADGPEAVLKGLIGVLERLDCTVVEMAHCPGTDVYALQIICSAHRTATKLNKVSRVAIPGR